jgi:DNA-binding NtrC family response regulator
MMVMGKQGTILVVDDENGIRQSFKVLFKDSYHVLVAETGKEAINLLTKNSVDLILLDILLPDVNGLDLLEKLKAIDPNPEVIMVTAVKDVQTAVKAIKLGAYEFIIKPFLVDEVLNAVERALEKRSLLREVTYLRNELERYHPSDEIIGQDDKMLKIFELISTIADSESAVLIQGESGTGKELVARAIHKLGPRKNHPFVVVSCAAIPPTLIETSLFGHHRGAFTGAIKTAAGKIEIANRGTVFLDDIDTLDVSMQAKLLRVIQEKEFERIGSTKVIKVDVRFVAASNQDLPEMIRNGLFREDLFFRLNVFPILLPPLRERRKDIPLLLNHFLGSHATRSGKPPKRFSEEALQSLIAYDWPGNVRELSNLVEWSFTTSKEPVIELRDISSLNVHRARNGNMTLKDAVDAFEQQYIKAMLDSVGGNKTKAAEILGIHRNTLLLKTSGSASP